MWEFHRMHAEQWLINRQLGVIYIGMWMSTRWQRVLFAVINASVRAQERNAAAQGRLLARTDGLMDRMDRIEVRMAQLREEVGDGH